jgi:hypothetical protein
VPGITGQVVILTVSSAVKSAVWYADLLGMEERGRYVHPDGHVQQVSLVEPRTGLELCLVSHAPDAGAFDEFRAGLDHLPGPGQYPAGILLASAEVMTASRIYLAGLHCRPLAQVTGRTIIVKLPKNTIPSANASKSVP